MRNPLAWLAARCLLVLCSAVMLAWAAFSFGERSGLLACRRVIERTLTETRPAHVRAIVNAVRPLFSEAR